MKIAFPVSNDKGLNSVIDDHFGTAANFLIVDTDTQEFIIHKNQKLLEDAVKCKTSVFKKKEHIDAVITRCMGDGSQRNLSKDKIQIFQAVRDTVKENLDLFKKNELKPFHIFDICQNKKNKKEDGCGHHH